MTCTIALDAAAGDHGLTPNIEGAIQAANAYGLSVILVGPAKEIESELLKRGISSGDKRFEVIDAPDQIGMDEDPVAACRAKPKASIMVCAELVQSKRAAGMVSCGHSGAAMVAALWQLKRLPGVLRPAIAAPIPAPQGLTVLIDAGANVDCKPWHLVQFAVMGAIYAEQVFQIQRPRVAILSNGAEDGKGNELVKEATSMLKSSGLEFVGAVEGHDLVAGKADVVVTDGFVGNVAVKVIEGTAASIFSILKAEIQGSALSRLGALFLRKPLLRLKRRLSYDEYGGGPLLGVDGNVVIAHGRSNAKAVSSALRTARDLAAHNVSARIAKALEKVQQSFETAAI
jgi:glycerol-3-phosphate acyltransferase PlsX